MYKGGANYVCVNSGCDRELVAVVEPVCGGCGSRTWVNDPAALASLLGARAAAVAMPVAVAAAVPVAAVAAVVAAPAAAAAVPAVAAATAPVAAVLDGAAEVARGGWRPVVVFWTLWTGTVGLIGFIGFAVGRDRLFLRATALAGGTSWYARHLYRGGRRSS